MATYKVIQDIEAEDHILGPLSLRQFIYAIIAVLCFYFCYLTIAKHVAFLMVIFLPPGLFCAFFAAPFGKDQPTEVWALAKIRFFFKPRRRIWDQNGMKELVSVTVPKKVVVQRTDGLSQVEVKSRLSALAGTLDSRGWVVKNVDHSTYRRPGLLDQAEDSERLLSIGTGPQEVPDEDLGDRNDIMDADTSPVAQQFDQMITTSAQARRQQLESMMQGGSGSSLPTPVDPQVATDQNWFMNSASPTVGSGPTTAAAPAAASQADEDEHFDVQPRQPDHMKTIQPLGGQPPVPTTTPATPVKTDTQQLAQNDDLNISTLARVANNQDGTTGDDETDDEVVISLR